MKQKYFFITKVCIKSNNYVNHLFMKNFSLNCKHNDKFGGMEYELTYSPHENSSNNSTFVKLLTGALIGFVNGFWGGGGGMICVPLLMQLIKLPEKKAHATTLLVMLPLSIASLIVYLISGNLEIINALKIGAGFVIGGLIGAIVLKFISNLWLGIIFSVVIIAGGIKLLL